MYKNKIIVNDFISDKLTLNDLILLVKTFDATERKALLECLLLFYNDNYSDNQMILYLVLWSVFKFDYTNIDNQYTSLIKKVDLNNTGKISYCLNEPNLVMYKQNDCLYLINNSEFDHLVTLPKEFQKREVFCVTCNEGINIDETLEICEHSFYILK